MKNMVLSNNYLFLDYDGFRPQAFDPCVDLSPPHKFFYFKKRLILIRSKNEK